MKIRIANYQSLANKFLEKAEKADEKKLFKLSSRYYSIAQKIYRIANSDLTEKINQNKNVIREYNRNNLEQFIEDQPNKEEIYAFFQSLEFPYEIHFGNTSTENRKQEAIRIINLALNLHKRGESSDIALALSHFQYNISGLPIDMENDTEELLNFIEQRKQKYGFINDRRMDFRTPTLLIEIHHLSNAPNEILPLINNRREFLNLMYSEGDHFAFDLEHFGSALTFNYIFGKQSIPFAQKCKSEYSGNPIVDIPHMVDNELSLDKLENDEKIGKFIIDNYFKANIRKSVEEWFKTNHQYRSEEKNKSLIAELFDPKNELTGVDIYGTIWKISDFTRLALPKLRTDIALIIKNWHSDVQIGKNEFKAIKDISNYSIEKLSKIIEDDITAQKIGYENITNYPLYQAMKKYQKDDIDSFLKIQDYFDSREESNWYKELSKLKVENDSYIARLLPKDDLRFPFVGAISGCCQKIRGHGEAAFIDSFYQDSGILIVTDKRDNIVSQSYVWINEGTISLDSIESKYASSNIDPENFKDIYQKACKDILAKHFDVVLMGNNNTLVPISDQNKIIPLDIYRNNAPKVYTYDTENGREVLYANPETIDQYPYISLMDKAKNNLIKPLTLEEIEIISDPYNDDIYKNIEKILVNKYINEIDDVINKKNLLSFYHLFDDYDYIDTELIFLCQTLNDAPLDFGISLNLTQFQIFLNKWLRDGGYINLHKQDESLNRDYHYIQQYIHEESFEPTKLYKTQKIMFAPIEEINRDIDVANFIDNLEPTEKESALKMLANNMSFLDILKKLQVETPEDLTTTKGAFGSYKPMLFKFLPSLIGTYIENNKFSFDDMEKVQELNIVDQYMAYQIGPMIDKGILNYYFQTNEENKQIIPTEDELNSISYYISKNDLENVPFVTEFANRFMNIIPEIPEMIDDKKLSHSSLMDLIATLIKKQLTNININDYNIQKIIFAGYSYYKLEGLITDKINNVYISLDLYRVFSLKNLIAPEINLIVDEDKKLYSVAIQISQLDTIQKVNVIVQAPLSLNEQMAKDLRYAKEKINYRNEDLIKLIQNYVNPHKIATTYNNYKSYERNASFKDYAFVNLRSELYELTYGQIDKVEAELEQIVNQRVNEYLSQFQPTPTQPITTPETQPIQPEEQKEITANRKTSRYTIKQK